MIESIITLIVICYVFRGFKKKLTKAGLEKSDVREALQNNFLKKFDPTPAKSTPAPQPKAAGHSLGKQGTEPKKNKKEVQFRQL